MNNTLHSLNILKSKLKSREEVISELKAQIDADSRVTSDRIDALQRERDALQRERDALQRDKDALQRECDALRKDKRKLKMDYIQLKSDYEVTCQELDMLKDYASEPGDGGFAGGGVHREAMAERRNDVLTRLSQFFEDEYSAKRYLDAVAEMDDAEITRLTNDYWKKGGIKKNTKKTHIWKELNRAGLYTAQESNWNAMVNFNRRNNG